MKVRALDINGDWTFGKGKSNYLGGTLAVAQVVQTRLYMIQGDCFWDPDGWVDWFRLLGSNQRAGLLYSIRAVILGSPGVDRLNDLGMQVDRNRRATLNYDLTTIYGTPLFGQVFRAPTQPYTGVSKFVSNLTFTGQALMDVDTSLYIRDATRAVWQLYEVTNGYTPVVGAVQALSATRVRVNLAPGATGVFRLVGVA